MENNGNVDFCDSNSNLDTTNNSEEEEKNPDVPSVAVAKGNQAKNMPPPQEWIIKIESHFFPLLYFMFDKTFFVLKGTEHGKNDETVRLITFNFFEREL